MSRTSTPGVRRLLVLAPLLLTAALLAACGSSGTAAGDGSSTVVSLPTEARTVTSLEAASIVDRHKSSLRAAAKAFHKCDRKISRDSYIAYRCLEQAATQTAVAEDLLTDLDAVQIPPEFATIKADVKRLAAAGGLVASRCAKAADQKCDQALARFRADEQSVLWDLDLQL